MVKIALVIIMNAKNPKIVAHRKMLSRTNPGPNMNSSDITDLCIIGLFDVNIANIYHMEPGKYNSKMLKLE